MTPLLGRIAKESTLPVRERTFNDHAGLLKRLDDVHCFECSEVFDVAGELAKVEHGKGRTLDALAFLPAPNTWLEWRRADLREGVLLQADEDGRLASARWAAGSDSIFCSARQAGRLLLRGDGSVDGPHYAVRVMEGQSQAETNGWTLLIYALLAMINTPRIIGQRTHMPHAGLQRRLAAARGIQGKFPLRAWTEIVLEVRPPVHADDKDPLEIQLTGARALHFVRSHLRVRRGQLEIVSAYWRGDASLGIKQSRYSIVPPKDGRWPRLVA